ncbi:calpain small subunit 1-like [Notothenia coriiceps]|uniref:Calpain small subunit 1-like n=1 Tax=Notothenia coriiceps TaxID=8208 RepID=A0A6I9PSR5_9TELE|nr:PREDICTED: calpain small subunit 1-like [Notothenia coriiceps]
MARGDHISLLPAYKQKLKRDRPVTRTIQRWNELNSFFARFKSSQAVEAQKDQEPCPFVLNRADVCKSFERVNPHKAPGPDGLPGRVLRPSPLLPVHTHDYVATHSSNTIVKFADDTTAIGQITDGDETAYRERVSQYFPAHQQSVLKLCICICFSPLEEDIDAEIEEEEVSEDDVDPHFREVFKQIAGDDMEVSVFELVKMLNNIVSHRSDIKTDGFSVETGRLIVSLLDKDESAKLGLMEFHLLWGKIQKYLEIFKNHDTDNSGTMSSHEMRGAATQAGFHINSAVLQSIVSRYADAQYAIDFDSFVGCLIKLEMLFKMFKSLERADAGNIELDMQQWLCLAIY